MDQEKNILNYPPVNILAPGMPLQKNTDGMEQLETPVFSEPEKDDRFYFYDDKDELRFK